MSDKKKTLIVTIVITAIGFLVGPMIFSDAEGLEAPTSAQLPFLIGLGAIEALTMGIALAMLIVYWKRAGEQGLRWTHLSIVWLLGSWWVHDGLHRMNGTELNGLIKIEYGFHVTLMIAAIIVAKYFLKRLLSTPLAVKDDVYM